MCVSSDLGSQFHCVINSIEQNKALITLFKFNWRQPCLARRKPVIIETRVCRCLPANNKNKPSLPYTKKNGKLAWLWHMSHLEEGAGCDFFFCHQMDTLPIISVQICTDIQWTTRWLIFWAQMTLQELVNHRKMVFEKTQFK